MLYRFKARDLFDKLLRLGENTVYENGAPKYHDVVSIVDLHAMFGDRLKSAPLPPGLFWVRDEDIVAVPEEPMEFSSKNELGEVLDETVRYGRTESYGTLQVCRVTHSNGCSVSVSMTMGGCRKTLYARTFYGKGPFTDIEEAMEKIDEDLIFRLDSLRR